MNITDLYRILYGRSGTAKGTDIDMSEQGRVGGVDTGQPFKYVSDIDGSLPTEGNNPSLTISEATVGTVTTTTIQKVISATTYTKTVSEDSSTGVTTVSEWT